MNTHDGTARALEDLLAMLPPESQEVMRALMASSRPTPHVGAISRAELDRLEEGDREIAVIGWVGRYLEASGDAQAALGLLPRALQIVYLSFLVEAEVMNGGFHQFFWNSSARFAPLMELALGELGATRASLIFREAWAVAVSDRAGRPQSRELSLEAFSASYEETQLNDFDAEFCELAAQFPALRRRLVDANEPAFYVVPREG